MTVGEKIYALRTAAGLSQETFAEDVGVSRQSVSKWETSAAMPDTEYVIKICKLFRISADELLLKEELPAPQPAPEKSAPTEPAPALAGPWQTEHINNLSIAGFVVSFFFALIGLIISCIAAKRGTRELGEPTHLAVAGIAIAAANLFFGMIFGFCYINLLVVIGG